MKNVMKTLLSTTPMMMLLLTDYAQGQTGESVRLFQERYRPQFHYTMTKGWINDPIGLFYYEGEYHIFNDHNPVSTNLPGGKTDGEQSHWSHAVSTDLVHWEHLPIAVYPDENGACWSGSGVVDWNNTAGFQTGSEPALVLAYTSAGATFGQSLVFSNDRGRIWEKYSGNTVIKQIASNNRDPVVFWHEPTKKWVMVLYVERGKAHFFNSDDLKSWTPTAEVPLSSPSRYSRGKPYPGGFHACPDLFELPVDGDANNKKWVIYDAPFNYWIGTFDGKAFEPEQGPYKGDFGHNFYASQSWETPQNKRVQIGWMARGDYPDMPFNQQMSFPCELSLRTFDDQLRLYRYPIEQIEKLYAEEVEVSHKNIGPADNPLSEITGDLFDIYMEVTPNYIPEFGLRLHDETITLKRWPGRNEGYRISALGKSADAILVDGNIKLRILVDRTSLEIFANDGEVSMSSCFLPANEETGLELFAKGGDLHVMSLKVRKLKSIWAD